VASSDLFLPDGLDSWSRGDLSKEGTLSTSIFMVGDMEFASRAPRARLLPGDEETSIASAASLFFVLWAWSEWRVRFLESKRAGNDGLHLDPLCMRCHCPRRKGGVDWIMYKSVARPDTIGENKTKCPSFYHKPNPKETQK
jgi:hypothetical protein